MEGKIEDRGRRAACRCFGWTSQWRNGQLGCETAVWLLETSSAAVAGTSRVATVKVAQAVVTGSSHEVALAERFIFLLLNFFFECTVRASCNSLFLPYARVCSIRTSERYGCSRMNGGHDSGKRHPDDSNSPALLDIVINSIVSVQWHNNSTARRG